MAHGASGAPVCTDCHGEHAILAPSEPSSPVNPARVSTVACGRCHADERLAQNYNLPLDKVPSFESSYHGLASRAGSQTVANCASCHGVHNILSSSDRRSTVHPDNLSQTCGQCHPGAGERFALGRIHVLTGTATEHPVVAWIRRIYWVLIPLIVGGLFLHNAVDFLAKLLRPRHRPASDEQVTRMNLHFRMAHWLTVMSFPVLVATGFALKFPDEWWAAPLLRWESGISFRGGVHRVAGVILIASLFYHAVHLALSPRDRCILRHMLPGWKDVKDFWNMIGFNLGLTAKPPQWGKFGYAEKTEYWAFPWGTVVMAATGLLLWFNTFTLWFFPNWVADAATALHYYEAILATLAVLVWHFYFVMFDPDVYPMDRTW
ncbi:MAG: cytochrome b/b6 domain-containing protein, partial [Acidobacteria bacterium]|nr:cytochrome b/b6 domain-containing protein [Acidobacteriota bacterium]